MSTPSKLHRLCVFLTLADEAQFSDAILTSLPAVRFVDAAQQPETLTPTFRSSLSESLARSRSDDDGLQNGELRASVPEGDTRTAEYIRELMCVVRAGGRGVFAVDPMTKSVAPRAERNFVAWPDAASRFGAKAAPLLTNGPTAWFTVER